jgi:FkbM family methyltransferase
LNVKQAARPVVLASVLRVARKTRERLNLRHRPRVTKYMGQDSHVIQCCVAYNRHGGYCVPLACIQRPAVQAILAGKVWEPETIDLLASHAAGDDVVHAGMFFGDFLPALARSRGPGAKVWAFEPNPENYRCALITAKINRLRNVELLNAGLGERRGSLPMVTTDNRGRSLGGASQIVRDVGQGTITVDVVTVDESIPSDRQVSLIQLDVENFEKQALAGALQTIRRCRPMLVLENLPAEAWLSEHLFPLGYRLSGRVHGNTVLRPD